MRVSSRRGPSGWCRWLRAACGPEVVRWCWGGADPGSGRCRWRWHRAGQDSARDASLAPHGHRHGAPGPIERRHGRGGGRAHPRAGPASQEHLTCAHAAGSTSPGCCASRAAGSDRTCCIGRAECASRYPATSPTSATSAGRFSCCGFLEVVRKGVRDAPRVLGAAASLIGMSAASCLAACAAVTRTFR
jgi:hypothetical protein